MKIWIALVVALCLGSRAIAQDHVAPAPGIFREPGFIANAVDLYERRTADAGPKKDGFFVDFGNMITGAGWISAGPGYRRHLGKSRAVVTTSAAVSWRLYTMAQSRIDVGDVDNGRGSVGAQALFQDSLQVNYFGLGNESRAEHRSGFRLRTLDTSTYGRLRLGKATLAARAGWLSNVDVSSMAGREPAYPDTEAVFTGASLAHPRGTQ